MSLKTNEEAFNDVMEEILDSVVNIQPGEYTIRFEQSKARVFSEYFKLKGNIVNEVGTAFNAKLLKKWPKHGFRFVESDQRNNVCDTGVFTLVFRGLLIFLEIQSAIEWSKSFMKQFFVVRVSSSEIKRKRSSCAVL